MRSKEDINEYRHECANNAKSYEDEQSRSGQRNLLALFWRARESGLSFALGDDAAAADSTRTAIQSIATPYIKSESKDQRLLELRIRSEGCKECVLHEAGRCGRYYTGDLRGDIAVVAPFEMTKEEILYTRKAVSSSMDVDPDRIHFVWSLRCNNASEFQDKDIYLAACARHLKDHLAILSPRIIISAGAYSAMSLMNMVLDSKGFNDLRGKVYYWYHYPVVLTCTPRQMLANAGDNNAKKSLYEDLLSAKKQLQLVMNPEIETDEG